MLSRVAESIYWISRYLERADNIARFICVSLTASLDLQGEDNSNWASLIAVTGDQELYNTRYPNATQQEVIDFLMFEQEYENSIISCLTQARENARSVRDVISSEMWEQINFLYLLVSDKIVHEEAKVNPYQFFAKIRRCNHLFVGLSDHTMSHSEAWHFIQLGRYLERADNTSRIVDVKYYMLLPDHESVGGVVDHVGWASLLTSTDGLEMYRKCYQVITPINVSEFLLFDCHFPRSIGFCLAKAEQSLSYIVGNMPMHSTNLAQQILHSYQQKFVNLSIDAVFREGLHEFVDGLQRKIYAVGEAVEGNFFTPYLMQQDQAQQLENVT